ncbi:MAG: pseudomonalisin [Candidatus Eremiobacteraeota bacterium]|nr:pseudomonalisin [Candidatus Eremiobacteraeota bacterium]
MKKLAAVALTVGLATASCSGGHGGGSALPGAATQPHANARTARAAAPAGWANTATQVSSLLGATDQGPLAATKPLTVRLGLALHNVPQLQAAIAAGQTIAPAQFAATYAPTAAEAQQVTSYLQSQGLSNVTVAPNRLLVSATGTAAQVAAAFDTTLHAFTQNGASRYANTTPAYVPAALDGIVVAVLGLNDVPAFKPKLRVGAATQAAPTPCLIVATAGCVRSYAPADYWRAYDVGSVPAASGVNVAVMAQGEVSTSIADFRTNEQADGLSQVPVVVKTVGAPSSDTAGADEWTLDMIASSGMAGSVSTLYLYDTTTLSDADIAAEYNAWVSDNLAPIGNSSFGGCEIGPVLDGSLAVLDQILMQGASQGQSMFASSGDSGSYCSVGTPNGVPAGVPEAEYPAVSPYVVAVGGTTLLTKAAGAYQGEATWYAGGGGISTFESAPAWVSGVQPAGAAGRGVPDIAMDGDPNTGMNIYTTSLGWVSIGGTSLSSPLAAGVWARMLQSHGALGFASPRLYREFTATAAGTPQIGPPPTQPHGGYHDVLSGANGAFSALPGYDYTTGLGTLDVSATNAAL